MRTRHIIVFVAALLIFTATPIQAMPVAEPFDASDGREVGRSAETNSLNGIYVSPYDDNVYVASVGGDEITVHDPNTGELLDRIGPERGVHGPDDIFITEDGTIYWTEILLGYVGKLAPGAEPVRQFVGPGVNPITMSDDGRLFVGLLFLGQGLYELDPELQADPVLLNEDLMVNSFDFGPDGYLYAPSFFTGDVLKIDVDSPVPVTADVVAGELGVSSAVKFNSSGEAFAVNLGEGLVVKVDFSGSNNHEVVLDVDGTIDNIAFATDDNLFVAVGADNEIVRVDTRGRAKALTRPGYGLPGGVAVTPDGTVWVSELFALRGVARGANQWTTSFYDRFPPPGTAFAGSTTVSADGNDLVIASGFSGSVQVMDPATGAVSVDVRNLVIPSNAIRHGDTLVATQIGLGNVVNAEDAGEVFIDGLAVPLGLASDGETLYVADWALGNVWAIDAAGPTLLASGLLLPEGIAVDGDRLLVVEPPLKQVTAIDLATGDRSPVIVGLDYSDRIPEGFFPFGQVAGVAVGGRWIYVSDDGVNKVYKFPRTR